ncbi:MAG TPA: aminotransferase class III-fold pyridoxal phosphate-dependent enzyme [Gemmatimonadaceae bacterium]|nr:aminotransferase class III-fold pyridoxal phosphate-dependent enzyme [Gemmatimonadaceae bacterium]
MTSDWRARAAAAIPGGTSTGSKRPDAMFGPAHDGPTHITEALGCRVRTAAGDWLIDLTAALGAVSIGYADPQVTEAVTRAIARGPVAGLPYTDEVTLAERLRDFMPAAEQARFLKSGAEACAAAVRIARAHTGRHRVLGSGYFGWLDWWTAATGVPAGAHADYTHLPFNDRAAWREALREAGDSLAAIMIEPLVEELADVDWLRDLRAHCDLVGAVLIFDEVKTGFRLHRGGAQALLGVTPDLTSLGKAIANGYPLAAVVGHQEVMASVNRTWISSTLATELTAIAAAHAVLDHHRERDVCARLAATGRGLRDVIEQVSRSAGVPLATTGHDTMFIVRWPDEAMQDRTLAHLRSAGVLAKRGPYQFATCAMLPADIAAVGDALQWALTR